MHYGFTMKTNISKLPKHQKYSFSSVLSALSLLGFLHPYPANSEHAHYRLSLVRSSEAQQNDTSSWYTPARSPAFNDLFGS